MRRLKSIHKTDRGLEFRFSDEVRPVQISLAWLRQNCRCVYCLEKKEDLAPADLRGLEAVGNYGFAISWSDGHRSIYATELTLDLFRNMSLPPHLRAMEKSNVEVSS